MNYLAPDRPALDLTAPAWHQDAACAAPEVDPDWWFPKRKTQADLAKRICINDCPVRRQCLAAAIGRLERWGVHAGIDFERDRRELTRRVS